MAFSGSLKREERIGLGIAAGLHVALVLAFLMQPRTREDIVPAQRMTVNLTDEVGLQATAPEPVAESRAAIAPTLSDQPAPAVQPVEPMPRPQPTIQPRLAPPVAAKQPAPPPVAAKRPAPSEPRPRQRPDTPSAAPAKTSVNAPAKAPAKASAKAPAAASARAASKPAPKAGGNRLGDNFLAGMGDSARTTETRAPAAALGASAKASLLQGIVREVKPHWQPPSGPDVDQLVSKVRFRLNQDGSLAGRPTLVSQRGGTDSNRTQADRHGEQAIRAVQLAAPFDLPEQYYAAWKTVTLDFDWKLSQ